MKVILYRNKEPEMGLDISKGFKIGLFTNSGDELLEIDVSITHYDKEEIDIDITGGKQ